MASSAKKSPGDEGALTPTRPARLRVIRPEVEEVLRSPRRGRPKLQHKEGGSGEGAAGEDDGAEPPRYDCAFQDEKEEGGGFAPPAMVWCKVRSHPWWPAQVFDPADASELALRHARSGGGATLVAYFWDSTFAWSDPSALLPFRANFARLAAKSTVFNYVSAVDTALEEVERRVEAGLSCSCTFAASVAKKQEVRSSGIREGAYGAVVDDAYMRDTFHAEPFLKYISALAKNPLAGANRLDLATAQAQLRSFNRSRGPRELPEFVIYEGIEDVAEATPHTKRKRMEKSAEDNVIPSKEKKARRGESSVRKRDAANEEAVDEDISVPSKSSARKKTSKDVDKREHRAKKDAMVEDSSVPSSKQSKSKISKSSSEKKKKKKYSFKDTDKGESLAEPAEEDATNEDNSMPSGEATDRTLTKERKSKVSKSSAKTKKKDISKDADKKESLPEPAEEDTTNEDSPMHSKGGKSKISKSSAKTKKKDTSKGADKKESLTEPAKEDAMGDDTSTPSRGVTDGTLRKETKSKISKSSAKKKKQDTSKDADGVETVGGSKTPGKKAAVDGTLSESKSGRRLRSTNKTEDASDGLKGPKKNGAAETTKGKDKDAALLKENNLGRRASSARQKDKITVDGDRLAGSSVKDSVSPGKKKSQVGETTVTKDSPISISEHGRKKKKLSELLVETDTPNRSLGGKSKARGKRSLPVPTEKPDGDTEDTVKTRGKRSLPASAEKPEDDPDMKDTVKTRGKRSLPESTEEPEDPDRDTKDTMKTTKRKKLDTLGDLSSQPPLSPKGSTKGREATPKAAGKKSQPSPVVKANGDTLGNSSSQPQPLSPKRSTKATWKAAELKPHTSHVVKANGEASQTRSRRTKNSETTVSDKSPQSVKLNKSKKGASTEDSPSCGEMHSQLCLAASDLKKVGKITSASVSFFTEFGKSSCPSSSDLEKEIPKEAANADSYASSPHADEETPEEAAENVGSPHADEKTPEEAAENAASPHADEETPEEGAEKVAIPHADEETPGKATNSEASPSEPPVADHMKDDYWADILINVEEPISRLKRKKDKSKSKTSKTKERQAEGVSTKEPPVSAGNVEVEEPTAAECKQDNTENGKAEAKPPSAENGGQPNTEEMAAEDPSLSGLVLHFSRPDAVPSRSDLIKIFSQYGPVNEARTETGDSASSAQVIFKRRMDAEAAFGGSGKMTSLLGPALVSFRLTDFPCGGAAAAAAASGNGAKEGASE